MRKIFLNLMATFVAGVWTLGLQAQNVDDLITVGDHLYKITGENVISNPSFENGLTGWYGGDWSDASTDNLGISLTGGVNDGAYCYANLNGGGAGAKGTLRGRWQVNEGETYLFACDLKNSPTSGNLQYNKLWASNDGTAEGSALYQMEWGSDWTHNNYVFTAEEFSWVIVRFGWNISAGGDADKIATACSYDNFFLGTVMEVPNIPVLETLIAEAKAMAVADTEGLEELNAAIEAAESKLSVTDVEEFRVVIAALEKSIAEYKIANATPSNPVNMTSLITNNNFSNGKTGWIENYVGDKNGDRKQNTVAGKNCWNSWSDGFTSMDIQQVITNLPMGVYKVTCLAVTNAGNITDQHAYAMSGGETFVSSILSNDSFNSWEELIVDKVIVTDGSITIGFASTSNGGTSGWFCVTDFQLEYLGFDATAMIETLNAQIAVAEGITGKMSAAKASVLATAITNTEAAIANPTKSALEVAATELAAAISAAQASVAEYADLQIAIDAAKALQASYSQNETAEGAAVYTAAITAAETAYGEATLEAADIINTLNVATVAYKFSLVPVEGAPVDHTDMIVNPSAENGIEGWTFTGKLVAKIGEHYSEEVTNPYFDGGDWGATGWTTTFSQEILNLPAGEYKINCVSRASTNVTMSLTAKCGPFVATSAGVSCGDADGELGRGWGRQSATVTVVKGQPLAISFTATTAGNHEWFSADEFELSYVKAAESAPAEPANVAEIVSGESYVIKHVASGYFLGDGPVLTPYGTNEAADAYKFLVTSVEDGVYSLQQLSSSEYVSQSTGNNWNVSYYAADVNPDNQKWKLTNVDAAYKIQNSLRNAASEYLGTDGISGSSITPFSNKGISNNTDWKIMLVSEYEAYLPSQIIFAAREGLLNSIVSAQELCDTTAANALYPEEAKTALNTAIATALAIYNNVEATSEEITLGIATMKAAMKEYQLQIIASNDAPADFTFMLNSPSFDNDSREGWTGDVSAVSYGVAERFNATTNFYQMAEGLPKGKYGLVAQGFYRAGDIATAMAAHADGSEVINAFFYMNDAKQAFKSLYDEEKDLIDVNVSEGYANGLQGASLVFAGGYYEIPEIQVFVTDGKVKLGVLKETTISKDWACFDNFKLIYYGYDLGKLTEELQNLVTEGKAIEGKMQVTVAQTLADSIAYAETVLAGEQTEEALQVAINKMKVTMTLVENSIAEYAKLQTAIDNANTTKTEYAEEVAADAVAPYETAISAAQDVYEAATAETTTEAISALDAATKVYLFTQENSWINPLDVTAYSIKNVDATDGMNGWTSVNAATNKNQHWDGTTDSPYFEQKDGWGDNSWSMSMMQEMTNLPAGKYALKVAMRTSSASATLTMTVEGQTVTAPANGDTGGNITTDGSVAAIGTEGVTFANNNLGRGWEWRTIYFELAETKTVAINIAASGSSLHQWCSFGNFSLTYNNDASEITSVELEANPASGTSLVTSDALDNVKLSIANKIDGAEYTVNKSATAQLAIGEDVVATGAVVEKDGEIVIEWSEGTVELAAQTSYTITVSENAVSYLRDGATVGNEVLVLSYITTDDVSVGALTQAGIRFNGSSILNPNGANLKVYAVSGNLVLESNENVNLSALNKGVYLLSIEGQASPVKFVVK